MKVKRKTKTTAKFKPITITLQTVEEVEALIGVLGSMSIEGSAHYTRLMSTLYDELEQFDIIGAETDGKWGFVK